MMFSVSFRIELNPIMKTIYMSLKQSIQQPSDHWNPLSWSVSRYLPWWRGAISYYDIVLVERGIWDILPFGSFDLRWESVTFTLEAPSFKNNSGWRTCSICELLWLKYFRLALACELKLQWIFTCDV